MLKFLYKSALRSFSLNTFWLYNFFLQNIGTKGSSKMLMKLTLAGNLFETSLGYSVSLAICIKGK